jgi:outer membrane usher protein
MAPHSSTARRTWVFASAAAIAGIVPTGALAAQPQADPAPTALQAGEASQPAASAAKLNTTGRDVDLVVPMRERVPIGQVGIRIRPDDSVLVSKRDVLNAISRGVTAKFLATIEALPDQQGYLPIGVLAQHGLALSFDRNALELVARFDPSAFPEQSIGLGFNTSASEVQPDRSANFAAFLSYQASLDWVEKGFDKGLHKPRANFDFDGRLLHTLSFENEFTYDGNQSPAFTRFGSRVFFDIPQSSIRLGAGDLYPNTTALQDQADISGLGISKLLETFHADRVYSASAGQTLVLREPATVTVVINGVASQTLHLDAGTYNVHDLPLTGGANRVDLVIEDAAGGRRVVSFDFFEDVSLLAPGLDEYDAKLGLRSDVDQGGRFYYRHDPAFSGFYRRGITRQLTVGVNAQATRNAMQGGGEVTWGSPFGLFTIEGSGSDIHGYGSGAAVRIQYRYSIPMELVTGSRRFDALLEYHSKNYGGIEEIPLNPYSLSFTGRYFQPVSNYFGAGIGIDYRKGRDGTADQKAIRADANLRLRNGMNFTGSVGYDSHDGVIFGISLFWQLGAKSVVTARYDSQEKEGDISYYYTPTQLLDTFAWGVDASHTQTGGYAFNGTGIYRTNRGDFEIDHRETFGTDSSDREEVSSLRARGTIAFADGTFAIGRYLTNSFGIVSAHPTLDGAQVLVGSQVASDAIARTGALGPALVSLGSYADTSLYYTVPNAPLGYDFGTGAIDVYPWFHSGTHVVIGSEFNVSILGTLLDAHGQPLELAMGSAHRIGDRKSPTVEIFTNRQGKLGASGLAPGMWQIDAGGLRYYFVIKKTDGSLLNLHELRPANAGETR